jgi:3-oxoacyl-[acyl-carrier-protein] synthase-1
MRRVVVTGMGIVSSIGNNTQEVLASLARSQERHQRCARIRRERLPLLVHGQPTLKPEEVVDKRNMRFMGEGSGWNFIAMEQAIQDAGLTPDEVSNERTGIIMGSGGPSARAIVAAADTTREKGAKRVGPFAVPKAMSSTASATLATPFEIKGVNYSISSACATSAHCIGNAYEQIQWGKQDIMFAGGQRRTRLDALGAVRRHGRDELQVQRHAERASRAYDKNRDGFVIAGGAGVLVLEEYQRAKARGAKIYAELAGYGATSDGYDMVAPSGEGAARCMQDGAALRRSPGRLSQHARHLDAGRRSEGNGSRARRVRRQAAADLQHQVADRPLARRGRACRKRSIRC